MNTLRRIFYTLSCFAFLMLLIPGIASAKSIFEHQNTTVPAGQTVDDLYVFGGNAEVYGQVTGVAVVVNGDLHLGSTADIKSVVVVIGGLVKQDPGAVLGDDIYTISLDSATQNSLLIGGGLALGLWVLQLAVSLLMILVPVLIRILGKQKVAAFTDRYPLSSNGRLILIGLLGCLILAALSTLLLVTVIGMPIIIVILLAVLLALAFGATVISFRIGEMFHGPTLMSDWMKVLVGAAILTAFINIPIVGWLLLLLVLMISLGISIQWIFRKRTKQ
ncbi:hypothetical protein [Paenibacillus rhizophilus]|uniref:Polymer-forming cytoskeletal protein n=1 Tax=Paenibacillus rhizophilus TaxID=1850366 RepID=A0A3N9PB53_9BACL|nr:hypothetical protein [Paenibacillus rhizophilus]RQW13478.1 hypothetical protein EH198_03390 [Paenibacillus rhizophilus]